MKLLTSSEVHKEEELTVAVHLFSDRARIRGSNRFHISIGDKIQKVFPGPQVHICLPPETLGYQTRGQIMADWPMIFFYLRKALFYGYWPS